MKKFTLCCFATILAVAVSAQSLQLTPKNIDKIIKELTLEEKAHLVIGARHLEQNKDMAGEVGYTGRIIPGAAGTTYPVPRLGIPAIVLADGPAGLRINPTREGDSQTYYCTGFPVGIHLASTWNDEIIYNVGAAIGEEVREYGVDVLLAPGVNILRNPLCGRNFEYYSEDPLLAGKTAAAMINGVESNGVGTSLKHFAVNNQEINRLANDSRVSMRALREIYLRNFEIAVKESQPWTIMTSYNYINGRHASEDPGLLEAILRDEWGFEGMVMTDWNGGYDVDKQIAAGNDLMMPGKLFQYEGILKAVKEGKLAEADLDICVKRVLELVVRTPRFQGYKFSNKPDMESHAKLTREVASEGFVLLKNDNIALPLKERKIALFGSNAYNFIAGGAGSGNVNRPYVVDLRDGLLGNGFTLCEPLDAKYQKYMASEKKRLAPLNKLRKWYQYALRPNELQRPHDEIIAAAQSDAEVAIVSIGRHSAEAFDRHVERDFLLCPDEEALLTAVSREFHKAGKKVIVILNICGPMEVSSWRDKADAILVCWMPGQEGGNSVADVLLGRVSPSGHLPVTFTHTYDDVRSAPNFPRNVPENGLNQSRFNISTVGKLYDVKNIDYTNYEEDIYVGYRDYATRKVEVAYPFGFGLTYSQFEMSDMNVKECKDGYKVSCTVKNTGNFPAKQVLQLYSSELAPEVDRPAIELRGYKKTPLLQAGEKTVVEIVIKKESLMTYNEKAAAWKLTKGDYDLLLGFDSQTLPLKQKVTITKEVLRPVSTLMAPANGEVFIK
jgi:beta-glucosidase